MEETQSWTSEFAEAFKTLSSLYQFLGWDYDEKLSQVSDKYPLFVPRTLAEKIKLEGQEGPLAKEYLPHQLELESLEGFDDPIGDKKFLKAPQLIHRYTSRVLFTPTSVCPVHCRYCFRKNELDASDDLFQKDFSLTLEYLKTHPEISEIIFTGGDPFTLSNDKLNYYLGEFSKISSVKDIRFHTRYPVILPSRLDEGLFNLLETYSGIFRTVTIAIHVNHKNEFDFHNREVIKKLSQLPVQLLSQTVLLKGVNDEALILQELYESFIELGIRPYYLHHPDRVKGGMHFYLSLEEGRKIYHSLRKNLPGWALPHYVIDVPGGFGKINAMNPETFLYSGVLIAGNTETVYSPEPF